MRELNDIDIVKDIGDQSSLVSLTEEPHKSTTSDTTSNTSPRLSKSWVCRTSHVPLYTGGKMIMSHKREPSFLLLPVDGDVVLLETFTGIQKAFVRQNTPENETTTTAAAYYNDDDEDGLDADAIVNFCLSRDDELIVTCSHNHMIRPYKIIYQHKDSETSDEEDTRSSTVTSFTIEPQSPHWGKSGHSLPVTEMVFHRSAAFLATGSMDGTVRVRDVRAANNPFVTHVFRPLQSSRTMHVTGLQWKHSVDELVLAVARSDGSVLVHTLTDNDATIVLRDHLSAVTQMQWNTPENYFVTTGRDSVVNVWKCNPQGYEKQVTLPVYEQVEGMLLLPNNQYEQGFDIVTAGSKGLLRQWSFRGGNRLELVAEQDSSMTFGEEKGGYLRMIRDTSQRGIVVADAEHSIHFVHSTSTGLLETTRTIVGHNDDILDVKILPNEGNSLSHIVVATNSPQVRIFDVNTFSCDTLDKHTATVLCVDVSPCGRFIATCGKDKQMRIWSVLSKECVAVAVGHTETVGSVALSKKPGRYDIDGNSAENGGGSFAVTVSGDRTLKRWNLPGSKNLISGSGKEIDLRAFRSERAHEKDINIVVVAPNDSMIATGSQDKTIKLWRATDLSTVATLKGHRRGIWDCQFSPHDRVLATSSGDKTIKVWSLADFSCVRTFQGHVASVLRVRFLNSGLQLLSSGGDGLVKLWTIRTNECECTMDGHSEKVWALDVAQDSLSFVSGGADSKLNIWSDNTQNMEEAKQQEEEKKVAIEQKLANYLRRKNYDEALMIAIDHDKPMHALRILESIISGEIDGGKSGKELLQKKAKTWSHQQLSRLLHYCRDWNTRSRNCHIAAIVVNSIVSCRTIEELVEVEGVPEIAAGIVPYMERHFDRLDQLLTDSYFLDFTLSSMGDLTNDIAIQEWKRNSKLVLPPIQRDGRFQRKEGDVVSGHVVVDDSDDVVTIGESDFSDGEEEPST